MSAVKRSDVQHNTADEVDAYVGEAVRIIELSVPATYRTGAVLVKVIELLASKTIHFVQPQPVDLGSLGIDARRLRGGL